MNCVQVVPPAALLTLDEAKRQVRRTDDTDDDEYLTGIIAVAQSAIEAGSGNLGRSIMPQTWELRLGADAWLMPFDRCDRSRWSAGLHGIPLPYPPVIALESVTYRDDTGAQQVLTGCQIGGDPANAPLLLPPAGHTWPATSLAPESIRIRYRAGYAKRDEDGEPVFDGAGKVEAAAPPALKHAALLLLAHLYEYRAAAVPVGSAVTLPLGFENLVQPFRVWS